MEILYRNAINPLTDNDEYLVLKIWPFYRPWYWGGYLGAWRLMLLCLTPCPLINYVQKQWKSWQLKGPRWTINIRQSMMFTLTTASGEFNRTHTNISVNFLFIILTCSFIFTGIWLASCGWIKKFDNVMKSSNEKSWKIWKIWKFEQKGK